MSQKLRPSSDEHAKRRSNFFALWMRKLAAAYRQEISLETQAMYLQSLADLPLDRLNSAFQCAVRECKFLPSIAEIRRFEDEVEISPEQLQAAHDRLRARLAAQPEAKRLASVLDEPKVEKREEIVTLTPEQFDARAKELQRQREQLLTKIIRTQNELPKVQ